MTKKVKVKGKKNIISQRRQRRGKKGNCAYFSEIILYTIWSVEN